MKGINVQKQILSIISNCIKEYDSNLLNNKVIFILEDKYKNVSYEEVFFPKSSFYHLTGTIIKDARGNQLNSYDVYNKIIDNKLTLNRYTIKSKDKTTGLKLNVLPQLMKIDRMANMMGDFNNYNLFLQTEKVAGNVRACMGFVKDRKNNVYVPNTALQKDIRDITENRSKIVAILKKKITEKLYCNITYLKNEYFLEELFQNEEVVKMIDVDKIYSKNDEFDKKILKYKCKDIINNEEDAKNE